MSVKVSNAALVVQFVTEAVLTALLALLLAFAATELLLPAYSGFLEHTVKLDYLDNEIAHCVLAEVRGKIANAKLPPVFPRLVTFTKRRAREESSEFMLGKLPRAQKMFSRVSSRQYKKMER